MTPAETFLNRLSTILENWRKGNGDNEWTVVYIARELEQLNKNEGIYKNNDTQMS